MNRCIECLNSCIMISENGYHAVCHLPRDKALKCFMGEREFFVNIVNNKEKESETEA